ncbi:MAG: hypothetical protein OXI63_06910 [Candidatus Poribacteria bacterium]|nr:hypothetical protein [Candidatus Poribacteria bacterium]
MNTSLSAPVRARLSELRRLSAAVAQNGEKVHTPAISAVPGQAQECRYSADLQDAALAFPVLRSFLSPEIR